MTATEAPANIVQKRCTTFKALMTSSAKCDGQWGKRDVQGCSGLMMLHWTAEHDLKRRSTADFPWRSVNGGFPVHIDESFDKHNQHYRQVHPAPPLVKSSSFIITAVVADQGQMDRIDGGETETETTNNKQPELAKRGAPRPRCEERRAKKKKASRK
jgi:hypothetical protein